MKRWRKRKRPDTFPDPVPPNYICKSPAEAAWLGVEWRGIIETPPKVSLNYQPRNEYEGSEDLPKPVDPRSRFHHGRIRRLK
jgi:hypothetical protein